LEDPRVDSIGFDGFEIAEAFATVRKTGLSLPSFAKTFASSALKIILDPTHHWF
jgi:hypothetical protein